ncbi:MAG: apolipoprotein N-acyltransferase [bacterium]
MRLELLLSLLTAFLVSFSFPPFQFGFLAYWGLVPFFYILEEKNLKEAFRWGYLTGLFISVATVYWINFVTVPGALATILIHPLYYSLYAMIHVFLRQRLGRKFVIAIPFVWTGIEYLKSLGELGFPWISLGYTQTQYLLLIQFASYTSVFGVSFWLVVINVLIYLILKNLEDRVKVAFFLTGIVLLFVLPWMYGRHVMPRQEEFKDDLRVAVVQGNIDPYMKWEKGNENLSYDIYEKLSRAAARENLDLIVWPETASPKFLLLNYKYLTRIHNFVDEIDTPLITGTPDARFISKNEYKTYNSVVMISPHSSRIPKYAKMQLVPFGERVPYEDSIPIFKEFIQKLEMGQGNFSPGDKVVVFDLPLKDHVATDKQGAVTNGTSARVHNPRLTGTVPVASVICFESIFPDLVRKFVQQGARLVTVITNDAWFGRDHFPWWLNAGLYQHAQMSVFRAIENRISIARCANTGVSMFIDPYGRVKGRSPLFEEAYLTASLPLRRETSFFTRHGNIFTQVVSGLGVLLLPVAFLFGKRDAV